MADFGTWIEEIIEDMVALEVTTLTKKGERLSLNIKLTQENKDKLDAAETEVNTGIKKLLDALALDEPEDPKDNSKKEKIRQAKKELRARQRILDATRKALGVYDPKDIFSAIRSNLTQADLVGYTRFELDGDSINFISDDDSFGDLVEKHQELVNLALETRKNLYQTAVSLVKNNKNKEGK